MSTPGLISHDDSEDRRRLRNLGEQRRRPTRPRLARVPVAERVQHARAGRGDLEVRLKAAIRIDLR